MTLDFCVGLNFPPTIIAFIFQQIPSYFWHEPSLWINYWGILKSKNSFFDYGKLRTRFRARNCSLRHNLLLTKLPDQSSPKVHYSHRQRHLSHLARVVEQRTIIEKGGSTQTETKSELGTPTRSDSLIMPSVDSRQRAGQCDCALIRAIAERVSGACAVAATASAVPCRLAHILPGLQSRMDMELWNWDESNKLEQEELNKMWTDNSLFFSESLTFF